MDFDQTPFLVIWETTQACGLVCKHCRASAQPNPLPGELTTGEGKALLTEIKAMGCPIVVLSGGDPLRRKDLYELIRHGKTIGLRMATIPAATHDLTREVIFELKDCGLDQIAFSLDFPTAELHDSFRGTPGTYDKTMQALGWAKEAGIPTQINTTITALSLPYLESMAKLVSELGIVFWEVFYLIPTGRGKDLSHLTGKDCEESFRILYDLHKKCPFILKVTEAPHYRRYVAQLEKVSPGTLPERMRLSEGPARSLGNAPKAVNSGKGFIFVSYKGDVFPSGFLPVNAGNVRDTPIEEIYRNSPVLKDLRDATKLKGVCGRCEYNETCGGSRSRAYAMTGDYLASDPWCIYSPKRHSAAERT